VGGLQAGAFANGFVKAIEHSAALSTEGQTESSYYVLHETAILFEAGSLTMSRYGGVRPMSA
jgi:hypothetical protein